MTACLPWIGQLLSRQWSDAIVVTKGERGNILGSEIFITVHCQECGERIIDSEAANVTFSRDAQPGERRPFKVVCLDCEHRDRKSPTLWIKLHEFIETLADSVGMKAQNQSRRVNVDPTAAGKALVRLDCDPPSAHAI